MQRQRTSAAKNKSSTPKPPSNEKLAMIRSGKKKKTITGFKENKDKTFENKGGKFVVVEKEKKFEEVGVTKKKRNFIKFESKLGTEKETDYTKIAGAKKTREIQPRTEEKIIQIKKRKEYLDNYQYHESKVLKSDKKPSIVVHKRLGDIIGGSYEETTYERKTLTTKPSGRQAYSREKQTTVSKNNRPGNQEMKQNKSSINIRNRPQGREVTSNTIKTTNTRTRERNVRGGEKPVPYKNETEVKKVTRTRITTKDGETKEKTTTTIKKK